MQLASLSLLVIKDRRRPAVDVFNIWVRESLLTMKYKKAAESQLELTADVLMYVYASTSEQNLIHKHIQQHTGGSISCYGSWPVHYDRMCI